MLAWSTVSLLLSVMCIFINKPEQLIWFLVWASPCAVTKHSVHYQQRVFFLFLSSSLRLGYFSPIGFKFCMCSHFTKILGFHSQTKWWADVLMGRCFVHENMRSLDDNTFVNHITFSKKPFIHPIYCALVLFYVETSSIWFEHKNKLNLSINIGELEYIFVCDRTRTDVTSLN
jgi:hypothetical protein